MSDKISNPLGHVIYGSNGRGVGFSDTRYVGNSQKVDKQQEKVRNLRRNPGAGCDVLNQIETGIYEQPKFVSNKKIKRK